MKIRTFFLLILISVIPFSSYGQLGGIMKRAINRQVNKEVDSTLDKKIQDKQNENRAKQKALQQQNQQVQQQSNQQQATSGSDQSSGNSETTSGNPGGAAFSKLFGNKVDLKYKDNYDFSSRIYMVSEVYDKKDVSKMDFYMYFSTSTPDVGIETSTITNESGNAAPVKATMVMDGENKIFLALTDVNGMKMGMISQVPDENTQVIGPDGKPVKNYKPPTFTKTGNTRVVAGYKCDEYSYTSEDKTSGKVWFTKDAKLKIDKRGWNSSRMSYYYGNPMFNDGIILANEAYDEKGKLQMKSETKEINENFPHSISSAGYTLRQINTKK